MMRGTVWLVAAMLGLGAGLVSTAGGASGPPQAGNTQATAPSKAGDDQWGEPTDEPVQAGQTPPAAAPEQAGDAPAPEPQNAPKKDAGDPNHKPVQAGPPASPPPAPEQAGSVPTPEPAQAKQPALALPAATPEQQQLEKDSAQLLHLVKELKVEVDKAGTDTLSLAAVRKADEIQKLAKNLKERMREREQEPGNKP
jgi:HAMP domain-containing protein